MNSVHLCLYLVKSDERYDCVFDREQTLKSNIDNFLEMIDRSDEYEEIYLYDANKGMFLNLEKSLDFYGLNKYRCLYILSRRN